MHDSRLCVCVCVCVHAHSFLPQTFHANGSIYHTHFFCTFFHFEYFGGLSTSIHKEMLLLCVNMCTWRVWNMLHLLSTFLTAWAPVWSTVGALEDGWIELNSTGSNWIAIQEVDNKCRGEQNDCWAHRSALITITQQREADWKHNEMLLPPTRTAPINKTKQLTTASVGEDMVQSQVLQHWWECKLIRSLWKTAENNH